MGKKRDKAITLSEQVRSIVPVAEIVSWKDDGTVAITSYDDAEITWDQLVRLQKMIDITSISGGINQSDDDDRDHPYIYIKGTIKR